MQSKSSTDIWFCAFLKLHGFEVANFDILNRNKGRYYFNISDSDWKSMKLKFNSSETSKIKMYQIALKDLLH